jgi:hypothetical protein
MQRAKQGLSMEKGMPALRRNVNSADQAEAKRPS